MLRERRDAGLGFASALEAATFDRETAISWVVAQMLSEETATAPAIWLGAHEPWWAWEGEVSGRLILSARRAKTRLSTGSKGRVRRATVPMFIDSGAYSELDKHDRWMWQAADFAEFVVGLCRALGTVEHAGIQDWMCEAHMLAKTGLTVEEHQRRTVLNFCLLRRLQRSVPWLPTLQGYTVADYFRCAQMYRDAGVRLEDHRLVGLGSVCRRSSTPEIEGVIRQVKEGLGVDLHGFGVKSEGALLACWGLSSMDSMAWSTRARYDERDLRAALGMRADATSEALMAVGDAELRTIDMDLEDFWRWKQARCPKTAANSLEYAETWRLRQTMALAARIVDELIEQREQALRADPLLTLPSRKLRPAHPGQLGLWA